MLETTIKVGNKVFDVKVTETEEERTIGLSKTKRLDSDEGMLFPYETELDELIFTMKDTSLDLDIIFIDTNGEVISVFSKKAFSEDDVYEEDVLYVLEVNINSGITPGDVMEEIDNDEDFTEEDRQLFTGNKMLILDSNGDVLGRLEGGERIFSRISTRKFIKQAIRAYKSDLDSDYRRLAKSVFKELDALDSRDPQYVDKT